MQRLPIGYREVEYLESTGTQWMDSNVPIAAKTNVRCKVVWTNISGSYPMLYGAWEVYALSSMPSGKLCIASGGYSGNNPWSSGPTIYANTEYEIVHQPNTLTLNNTIYTIPNATVSNPVRDRHILMFAASITGNTPYNWSTYAKARVYYFKIYNDSELVRNFVPCVRTSDGKPGLYDTVSSTFYVNAGTGEFSYGPYHDSYQINLYPRLPLAYQEVEYINFSGAQQINTGTKFDMQNGACEITVQASTTSQNGMLLGSQGTYFWLYYYAGAGRINLYVYASAQHYIQGIPLDLNKHVIDYRNKSLFIDDTMQGTFSQTLEMTTGNLFIGSYGGNYFFQGKVFGCKIWDATNKLIRHFIPCYRKSDNVIGMYDIVNQKFYTNAGSGTFTKGSDIGHKQWCRPSYAVEGTTNLITEVRSSNAKLPAAGNGVDLQTTSGDAYCELMLSATLVSGATYTLSFDVTNMKDGESCSFGFYDSGMHNTTSIHNGRTAITFTAWKAVSQLTFDDGGRNNTTVISLRNFQLEKKDHATLFTPYGTTRADNTII